MFHQDLARAVQEQVRQEFVRRGVDASRLDLREGAVTAGYLGVYGEIDAVLDTFPCTGGVTTCEALWMGVPVLSLCGARPIERNSATFLSRVGLADWAVASPEAFVAKAESLNLSLGELATLRAQLRERMAETVCNARHFTKVLEECYRDIWRRWVSKQRPDRHAHT
jgi:predicted O-linked N-acetylglucosamine transferase (SPINDLY family)